MPEKYKLTIDQVALLAGVSRSVVSRVLNDHPKVSLEARARVLKVINEHNYRPSSVARSLATDRTFEICTITPRGREDARINGIWPLLHLGITDRCFRRGYFVSLVMLSSDSADVVTHRIMNERLFDGYILITHKVTELILPEIDPNRVPVVLIGRDPANAGINSIDVDNFEGAFKATAHLIQIGYRNIGAILGDPDIQETIDRRHGYLKAMVESGLSPFDSQIAMGPYTEKAGYETMKRWIDEKNCPRAVFCGSDGIAMGVLLAVFESGMSVPNDVAVIGFDDTPTSQYMIPPLTTVRQPIYDKGVQAANTIIDQIEGKPVGITHIRLPAELIVRESCGAGRFS